MDATAKTALCASTNGSPSSSLPGIQKRHTPCLVSLIWLTDSLQRSASQNDYISLFLENYLPRNYRGSSGIPSCSTAGWIVAACTAARNHDGKHGVLKLAVIACSLCMLGYQQGDDKALREGRLVYGRALLQLKEGLHNIDNNNRLALIRTARMLSLFEVYRGRTSSVVSPRADFRTGVL